VETAGKVWLLTVAAKGGRSKDRTFVAETELLPPIPPGPTYNIVVAEADLGPEANVMTHKHSGPETWYLLSGEQCLELPDRVLRARAGETMSAPAETPMKLNIVGPSMRRPIPVKSVFCSFRDFFYFSRSAKPPLSPPFHPHS
jgi:quercetin dioxygenase-like cupin family protein